MRCPALCVTASELEAQELKEEFARRLGEQQRTIDILKVSLTDNQVDAVGVQRLGSR